MFFTQIKLLNDHSANFIKDAISQAYERLFFLNSTQPADLHTYNKNRKILRHTSTLLIHNLKYLSSVTYCFTKGKNNGRV